MAEVGFSVQATLVNILAPAGIPKEAGIQPPHHSMLGTDLAKKHSHSFTRTPAIGQAGLFGVAAGGCHPGGLWLREGPSNVATVIPGGGGRVRYALIDSCVQILTLSTWSRPGKSPRCRPVPQLQPRQALGEPAPGKEAQTTTLSPPEQQ